MYIPVAERNKTKPTVAARYVPVAERSKVSNVATPTTRPNLEKIKAENKKLEEESKKDNSILGFTKNAFKSLPKSVGETILGIGQSSLRGMVATGRGGDALGRKILGTIDPSSKELLERTRPDFTPQGQFQQDLYGTKDPISFSSVGKEVTGRDIPVLNPFLGAALSVSDAIPGGSARKKGLKTVIENTDEVVDVVKSVFKSSDELKSAVSKEIFNLDTVPATVNNKPLLTNTDTQFRLDQLKSKLLEGKALTTSEAEEAVPLLKQSGIDLTKPTVSKTPVSGETPQQALARSEAYAQQVHPKVQYSDEGIPMARKKVPFMPKTVDHPPKKLSPSLIDTTTGEGRSLEIAASREPKQIVPQANSQIPLIDDSLTSTVSKTKTPVNNKINFIDTYLRTPEVVAAQKLGLGKEVGMLREGADLAKVEVKQNLNKISDWIKRVPGKEANENIFDFLDGKAIDLPPVQKQVALEIKSWLKSWAKRMGLPEDRQVSWYITHIWDKDLQAGDFPEELAKLIDNKIPGQVYNPFLLERQGLEGYKRDTWAALDAYVKRGTRKVHMDPALELIKEKSGSSLATSKLEKSQFKWLQKYIDNVNMRPSDFDTGFNNLLQNLLGTKTGKILTLGQANKLGPRPYSTILRGLRKATFSGMLGGNVTSALRNISQGVNIYSTLGEKHTFVGYKNLYKNFTKEGMKELIDEGIFENGFIQDRVLSSFKKKAQAIDKGLFFLFDTAEKINRGAAYWGAKSKALAQGMSENKARDYAKEIVRKTQFLYDTVDTPVGLSSDTVKTLTQFGTYSVKQMEFLASMAKDKNYAGLIRYALSGLAFTYTIGRAFDMKPEELVPFYGSIKRGQLPFGQPPSLKAPWEITKALVDAPDRFGNPRNLEKKLSDIGSSAVGLVPGGIQMKKLFKEPKEEEKKSGLPKLPELPKIKIK